MAVRVRMDPCRGHESPKGRIRKEIPTRDATEEYGMRGQCNAKNLKQKHEIILAVSKSKTLWIVVGFMDY